MSLIKAAAQSNRNNPSGESILGAQTVLPSSSNIHKVLVEGCSIGDFSQVSFSGVLNDVILTSQVVVDDTVQVRFYNPTTKPININIGTLRVSVTKKQEV